jgi:hypothetical protein
MCSRSELAVNNSGNGNVKLLLASDLAQILEEKNLMLVGDGENFKVVHLVISSVRCLQETVGKSCSVINLSRTVIVSLFY